MKRLLDCRASDFAKMDGQGLKKAIRASAGRTVMAEVIVTMEPLLQNISGAELMSAFGADMILLNLYDVNAPAVRGLEGVEGAEEPIRCLKRLTGRPVGLNLEPVDPDVDGLESLQDLPAGRKAEAASLAAAEQQGADFVCLTGNPATGVSNSAIKKAIYLARTHFNGLIIAGKMHGAGVDEDVMDPESAEAFVRAGADVVLLPAPGAVPGVTEEMLRATTLRVQKLGALALSAIGTSQEGADEDTVRQIALSAKRAGVDIQHIGDSGVCGTALPENLLALSTAIRGRRHTYVRMAQSVRR